MNQDDHWKYSTQEWQRQEFFDLLKEAFTQPIKTVWDVGACVGGWSYIVANSFNPTIYAFEPFPDNFEYIVAKEELKDFPITPVNCGIWYGKKEARAMWRGSNIGAIFIDEVDTTMCQPTGKKFKLNTLEEMADRIGTPDFIKFDVEGAEVNIIEYSTLLKEIPQLLIEWHPDWDAVEFFAKHLPHKVIAHIGNGMYLLRL